MQYSFCRSNLIQGKSEWENTSETDSPSGNIDGRNWKAVSYLGTVPDFVFACSDLAWKRWLRKSALLQKYRSETNCAEIVRRDSKKLISEQKLEISGVSELQWWASSWQKLSLVHDKETIELMKAKVSVLSDSVLCVGGIREFPESNEDWERRLAWFKSTHQYKELDGIDGNPVWSPERMIFPGHTTMRILYKMQNFLATLGCEQKQFQGRITFMSMFHDIDWWIEIQQKGMFGKFTSCGCVRALGHWSFLGPSSETTWYNMWKYQFAEWHLWCSLNIADIRHDETCFDSQNQRDT